MKSSLKNTITDWIKTIVFAVVLSLVVRTYVAEARWIPSESMLPTLKVGDHLLIDKLSYKLSGMKWISRGDIVVFKAPQSANLDEETLIKRVIGLPGETISVKDGYVYINGQKLIEPYILQKPNQDFAPFTVPKGEVFVMGDNRNNSFDSRFWGPLPESNIIGKAELRFYPLNQVGLISHS